MDGSSSEGPVVEIVVPPGVAGGMLLEFSDETGNIHSAVVPDGLVEGDVFTVQLPPPEPPPLEIVIPSGLQPGDAFVVQHEGQEFEVIVPDGSYGDDVIFVHAPPVDEPAAAPEPAPSLLDKAPVEDSKSMSWYSRTEDAPQKGKGVQLSLNLGGGLSLNLALAHQGKYKINSAVEVYRTDGSWSPATVKDYDWRGVTYTVELYDFRLKYFVEEDELRLPGSGDGW